MIQILCVGKIKESYLNELINDYAKRISRYHKIEIIEVKDSNIEQEAILLSKYIKPNDFVIAMALEGKMYDSVEMAKLINNTFNSYGTIDFVIGGSYGLADDIKKRANLLVSMSKMTFPHGLFRGILLEQIYRTFKINNNETYHK